MANHYVESNSKNEKHGNGIIERVEDQPTDAAGLDESLLTNSWQPDYSDKETKRILRKVDWRLVPLLAILYLLAFIDRGNLGNAKVAGMNDDLQLTGQQYNMALTVFFFPYAALEVPSNIILKKTKPSIWIGFLMVCWGVVMTLQGIIKTYHQLLVTRILLGVFEAGFFPAATFLLTTWYCRFEVQTRLAVFFSAASAAGAFSGLLAFGIQKMDGIADLAGWRWIFILEGIVTVVVGASLFFILPDSPSTASWLKPWESQHLIRRLEQDAGTAAGRVDYNDGYKWSTLKSVFLEWKIWLAVIVYWGNSIPIYGFTYTAPSIILELGYTSAQAQLLTVPIYTVGVISTVGFSFWADSRRVRWPFITGPFAIAAVGLIGLLSIPHPRLPGLTYFFLFFIPAGIYPALIGILSLVSNNLAGSWKRAVGMALLISIGNFGGAIGSNIFQQQGAPQYWLGYGFCFAIISAAIVGMFILRWAYSVQNKKRDAMSEEEIKERYTEEELEGLGDKSPHFRYVT